MLDQFKVSVLHLVVSKSFPLASYTSMYAVTCEILETGCLVQGINCLLHATFLLIF